MKLSILGKHPIPQGGFNGVMSLFEAIEFSRLGYDTALLIPFLDHAEHSAFLEQHKLKSLDELPRFGGRFAIRPVFPDGENFDDSDVVVYQSYFQQDWDNFGALCRRKAKIFTKNFPKFVPSADTVRESAVIGHFRQYDLVACALRDDVRLLASNREFVAEFADAFVYAPRGATPTLLHPGYKAALPPTLGFDVPVQPDERALAHFVEPVRRLKWEIRDLQIVSVGRDIPELGARRVPFGRFDRLYEDFFNRIHFYCTINYAFSPAHLQASVQREAPGWQNKPIYEVQNVEAQMSGAPIVGHRDNLIDELYVPGATGLNVPSFEDADAIYRMLRHAVENRAELGRRARAFAETNFSWTHCIGLWSDGIRRQAEKRGTAGGPAKAPTPADLPTLEPEQPSLPQIPMMAVKVPDQPQMPKAAVARLREALSGSQCYLEYGTGGTTIEAARSDVAALIAVESDKNWLDSVAKKLEGSGPDQQRHLLHANIGPTQVWGYPVNHTRWHLYQGYPLDAWRLCREKGLSPDLVLIDGRFRVACFLASCLLAQPGSRILFDDFVGREQYEAVERFVKRTAEHDRMAEFVVPADLPRDEMWLEFAKAATVAL